jgi:hypothetical protein
VSGTSSAVTKDASSDDEAAAPVEVAVQEPRHLAIPPPPAWVVDDIFFVDRETIAGMSGQSTYVPYERFY